MKAFILCALFFFVASANARRAAVAVARSDDQEESIACLSATAGICQDCADRGVCKNGGIDPDYLNNDDDSFQDEIDYFDQLNEDITLCPQCGCKEPEPATCDYGRYCAIIDCTKTGASDLCPDQCIEKVTRTFAIHNEQFRCLSKNEFTCQECETRGVCKNEGIVAEYLDYGDQESDQEEIDNFTEYYEKDITLCPQCGCREKTLEVDLDKISCEDVDLYRIWKLQECKDAVNQLNIGREISDQFIFRGEKDDSSYPGGCYVYDGADVYFNEITKNCRNCRFGAQEEKSRLICGLEKCSVCQSAKVSKFNSKVSIIEPKDKCTGGRRCNMKTHNCVEDDQTNNDGIDYFLLPQCGDN